jgi:hypothetical protein
MRYNREEKIFITKKYAILGSTTLVRRAWRSKYTVSKAPGHSTILNLARKFNKNGSIDNLNGRTKNISQKRKDAKIVLKEVVSEKPDLSIREAAQVADISRELARMVLKEDLKLKPYKLPHYHELKPGDPTKRLNFSLWFRSLPQGTAMRLICSDEAYFCLTEPVNKQNNRLWLSTRPTEGIEQPLYDQKVLVWCAMSSKRIYGPYFFEGTVNQHSYHRMLIDFFWPKVVREDYKKYYFQQDGASSHTAKKVQNYLRSKFGDKFMDKNRWPPRSPDLNPCDFYLWGYLKARVYNPLPKTLDELKSNIRREIEKITKDDLKRVFLNFEKRVVLVIESKGGHIEE